MPKVQVRSTIRSPPLTVSLNLWKLNYPWHNICHHRHYLKQLALPYMANPFPTSINPYPISWNLSLIILLTLWTIIINNPSKVSSNPFRYFNQANQLSLRLPIMKAMTMLLQTTHPKVMCRNKAKVILFRVKPNLST